MGKRKILVTILIVFSAIAAAIAGVIWTLEANLNKLAVTTIAEVELSGVEDGIYTGSYRAFPIAVVVEVEVSDHTIRAIKLIKHENGQGKPAEVLTRKVVEAQSLNVDTVAGATYSSKVILKAIESALSKAE